jgi:hypothetical protein
MNYSTWSLKRRSRADVLRKNDWVLIKRPGNIRGARLRWEGLYIFRGYKNQETKRQAVLEDGKGKKWYRASNQIRQYYPKLDFTNEYLDLMKRIDAQVPAGREIEQRFVEQVYQAPSFVTLRIAEKLMRIRRTVRFVPADKPLRLNLQSTQTRCLTQFRFFPAARGVRGHHLTGGVIAIGVSGRATLPGSALPERPSPSTTVVGGTVVTTLIAPFCAR